MARPSRHIPRMLREVIRERAEGRCEYCRYPDSACYATFDCDHYKPQKLRGRPTLANLVWACPNCNASKGGRGFAVDPLTKRRAALFNPRTAKWADNFAWSGDKLEVVGLTPVGRATIAALRMNRQEARRIRELLIRLGLHPPQ